tara:strand:- start:330 stop:509 length:180 start_codon:yes stop_codon:yes gene_type:complete
MMTSEEKQVLISQMEAAHAKRVAEKGHDCDENIVHAEDENMALRDYYYCGICNDLLQVG